MSRSMKWNMMAFFLLVTGLGLTPVGLCTDDQAQDLNVEVKHSNNAYPDKVKVNRVAGGLEVNGVVKQIRPSRLPIGGYVLVQLLDRDNKVLAENRGTLKSASKEVARTRGLEFSVIFPDPPIQVHTVRVRHKLK